MENKNHMEHPSKTFMRPIAHIRSNFPSKFGIPRQSGIVTSLKSTIVFEPEFRNPEALRGLEEFSHIWLIWEFSQSARSSWSATVRPPRLGGNERKGVFATRSPFRPNPIGLSCVRLVEVRFDETHGPVLVVAGVDLMDKTPIYDIKPYLPYVDAHPEAMGGFGDRVKAHELDVLFLDELRERLPEEKRAGAIAFLKQDPRPAVHKDPARVYKIAYAGYDIHFTVEAEQLTVVDVVKL